MLELINRARENPAAEAARLGIGLNDGMTAGTITTSSKQPLAGSGLLERAAASHSFWMLENDVFSHTGAENSNPGDRIEAEGYTDWTAWGENLSWAGTTGTLVNSASWIERQHDGLFKSPGHRENLMFEDFTEVGIAQVIGEFEGYNTSMITQNFASEGGSPILLGVVFDDKDGDNFFDPGEELSGVEVTTSDGQTTITGAGGGYEMAVGANQTITVTFSGGDLPFAWSEEITVGSQNVKVDLNTDDLPAAAVIAPEPPTGSLEIGTLTFSQGSKTQWRTVEFTETIENAVVVMGPLSSEGSDPATVRVRNVTDTGFEFQMDEWDYLDGTHKAETVSWIAASEGTHTLSDGRTLSAGEVTAQHSDPVSVGLTGFDQDVAVFAQVASYNGAAAVEDRISNVSQSGFTVRMQEEEDPGNVGHRAETVSWIAIEEGGSTGGLQVGTTGVNVTHGDHRIDLDGSVADAALIADIQTLKGTDTVSVRYDDFDTTGVDVRLEEEKSRDNETGHTREDIGWLVAENGQYDLFDFA
ncbi:MAG: CAP domain-containing protein [Pseudomonadota bacterium]